MALLAFAATSPGLSGLELAAHLGGWVDLSHERQVHLEPAGHSGHSDTCQLGVAACHSRLPAPGATLLRQVPVFSRVSGPTSRPLALVREFSVLLPRAPPA